MNSTKIYRRSNLESASNNQSKEVPISKSLDEKFEIILIVEILTF